MEEVPINMIVNFLIVFFMHMKEISQNKFLLYR